MLNHEPLRLADGEYRFACLVWDNEPLPSGQLVTLAAAALGWKKSTTYTVLKKLCERGVLQNSDGQVTSLIRREDVQQAESAAVVDKTFGGSLPRFVAAFLNSKPISEAEAAEIRALLPVYNDSAQLDAHLAARQAALLAEQAQLTHQLRLLDTARERLRKEADMNYNVTIKTLPARYAACVRMTIPCYEAEGMVWDVLCRETDHMPLVPDDPCYCSVTFLDEEYKERDVLIEASKTVRGRYPDTEHVRFRTLPPVTYAGCVFRGSYAQISDVIAAVAAWVTANGYESAGPMFDIYHVSPHETQNPDEFVTEVCFPVREA